MYLHATFIASFIAFTFCYAIALAGPTCALLAMLCKAPTAKEAKKQKKCIAKKSKRKAKEANKTQAKARSKNKEKAYLKTNSF